MLNTPIPQIMLAYEGRIDCLIEANPFISRQKEPVVQEPESKEAAERLHQQRESLAKMKSEARRRHQQ